MKTLFATLLTLTLVSSLFGQDDLQKTEASITAEGKRLYKSEMASWYGTDIFLEKFKDRRENLGGYFSYSENDMNTCLFFSKGDQPKVIGSITFDNSFKVDQAKVDGQTRDFTRYEEAIYLIRKKALAEISSDTLFKTYQNTNLNIVPLYDSSSRRVYVLTGPTVNGVVVFGNDYLITFDNANNLIAKKRLHQNIIPLNYGQEKGKVEVASMHSHLPETGDMITATDICTLMLYEKFPKWQQHVVMSGKYVSIWDCEKDTLAILTRQAWEKISSDQGSKRNRQ
jgi:hypothetical protein